MRIHYVSGWVGKDIVIQDVFIVCLFVNRAVVEECKCMLVGAGFTELKERDTWMIEPGNKV